MTKNEFLEKIIDKYTLSNTDFEKLKSSYDAISNWLAGGEKIQEYGDVEIIPQGSLALGTAVKPIDDEDDFDVDLLAKIKSKILMHYPEELKKIVGDRLKENERYKKNIEEGKRCWKISFEERHADILPCVPDYENESFLVTTEKTEYGYITHSTNPLGYRRWFFQQAKRTTLLEDSKIEELTFVKNRTNLQKIVQLCKLHRNFYYKKTNKNLDDKPISIIISTLAAYVYKNCKGNNLYDQFVFVVENLESYIKFDGKKYIISNPVDSNENFADKWITHPQRRVAFFEWLNKIQNDVRTLKSSTTMISQSNALKQMFGVNAANNIYSIYGNLLLESRESGKLFTDKTGTLNMSSGSPVTKHTFYGDKE